MEKKYDSLWKFHTKEQNDFLVSQLFSAGRFDVVMAWLKGGLELNTCMLSEFVLCHPDVNVCSVVDLVVAAKNLSCNVQGWLSGYLSYDELMKLMEQKPEIIRWDFPSDDFCVEHQLWDILKERDRYFLLAKYQPEVIFGYTKDFPYNLLLREHPEYLEKVFEAGHYSSLLVLKDGWKYLIDHGKVSVVLEDLSTLRLFDGLEDEVIDYCLAKGYEEELYRHNCHDALYLKGRYDVFVEMDSLYEPFLLKFPSKVRWEVLWDLYPDRRGFLLKMASDVFRGGVPDNADYSNVRHFLKKHSKWRWLMSFFH